MTISKKFPSKHSADADHVRRKEPRPLTFDWTFVPTVKKFPEDYLGLIHEWLDGETRRNPDGSS